MKSINSDDTGDVNDIWVGSERRCRFDASYLLSRSRPIEIKRERKRHNTGPRADVTLGARTGQNAGSVPNSSQQQTQKLHQKINSLARTLVSTLRFLAHMEIRAKLALSGGNVLHIHTLTVYGDLSVIAL